MKKQRNPFLRVFGGRATQNVSTLYKLEPYSPAYHPSLVIRKRPMIAGWIKLAGVGMVLVFTVAGYTGWRSLSEVNQIYAMQKSLSKPIEDTSNVALKADASGKTNILLLGIAGAGNKGPDLTDMMTVLQVDASTKKVSYVVLPRKLEVQSNSGYYGKWQSLNTLYSAGKYSYLHKADAASADPLAKQAGFAELDRAVTAITGITVHYNVVVDYAAFAQAIDSVGGVTVTAQTRIVDRPLTKGNSKSAVIAQRGEQTLTGKQAILYARTFAGADEKTRETQRIERQMQIVKAYARKLSSVGMLSNPSGLHDILNSFGASFYSDMKPTESALAAKMLLASNVRYTGFLLYDAADAKTPFTQTGTARSDKLEPKAGKENYTEVQAYLATRLNAQVPVDKEFAILE